MAAIAHGYEQELTLQTHTGDTNWTTKVTASASGFVANAKYLILCVAHMGGTYSNGLFGCRLAHGSTPTEFLGSQKLIEPLSTSSSDLNTYGYMTVWTQPGTAEDIVFQLWTYNDGYTVHADTITIFWMRLDDDLVDGTDYKFAEVDDSGEPPELESPPSWTSGASVTFTPDETGDWLVIGHMTVDPGSAGYQIDTRINRDSGSDTAPMRSEEPEDTNEMCLSTLFRVYNIDASSHTFTMEGQEESPTASDLHHSSRIFALRLGAFADHDSFWNEGTVAIDTSWVEIGNCDFTPTTTADFLILALAVADSDSGGEKYGLRTQLGGTTTPSGSDAYYVVGTNDTTDEVSCLQIALPTSLSGSQDLDMDILGDAAQGNAEDRALAVVSMELSGAAAPTVYPAVISISLAALSATITAGEVVLTPAVVGLNITALDATVSIATMVDAQLATSTLAALDATISVGEVVLTPSVVDITISALDAAIVPGEVMLPAGLATATISALDATISASVSLPAQLATLTASALDVTIAVGEVTVSPSAVTIIITALDATISVGEVILAPSAVAMTVTALDAGVSVGVTVTPAVVTASLTALDATIVAGEVVLAAGLATVTLTALDATVATGTIVDAQLATATVTAIDATIVVGEAIIAVSAVSITVTALDAVANAATMVNAELATATVSALDATISATVTVSVSVVIISATALPATILPGEVTVSSSAVGLLASALDATVALGGFPGYVAISDCAAFNVVIADVATGGVSLTDAATAAVTIEDQPQ